MIYIYVLQKTDWFGYDFAYIFTVAENTESVDNPLHDAAKRGNIEFMNECLTNRVSISMQ